MEDDYGYVSHSNQEGLNYDRQIQSAFDSPEDLREQEAHFFWTISDFEQLVRDNGAYLVVKHMSDVVKEQLYREIKNEGM